MNYPIFLIGFMASGKTSKGKKLATKLGVPFYDLDQIIEERKGKTIVAIFETEGEDVFRKLEAETLRTFSKDTKAVIALGGGTPCFKNNMEYINRFGTSVYLKRSEGRILGRLRQSKDKRPLVASLTDDELKSYIEVSLTKRLPFYQQADIVFDADKSKLNDLVSLLELTSR